jgi:conjugal transfer/type IV secretion protein DotA/TraY
MKPSSHNTQVNPLIALKNMGDRVMGSAEIAFAGMIGIDAYVAVTRGWSVVGLAAKVVNGVSSAGDIAVGIWRSVHPFVFLLILALFMFGITLSVVIPMMPFVIWIGALLNWLVVVGEGIVAAPLWALAHLGAEGEGLGQRPMHGYLFLLNMGTRPFLMVIGFFLGGATLTVIGTFAIPAFEIAVANAQANSITGLFTVIAELYVFIQLFLALTQKCFNLVLIMPDTVLTWVGIQMSARLGFEAGDVGSGFERGKDKTAHLHEKAGPVSAPKPLGGGNGFEL